MSQKNALLHYILSFQDIVFDDEGRILAGSLKALIRRLVPRKDFTPDRGYIFAFLLNSRIFISPCDLLQQIVQVLCVCVRGKIIFTLKGV